MVSLDPENPVVKLCLEGMQAEAQSRMADARRLFTRAWEESKDDYDACVAAHFLARHQPTYEDMLHWNREALSRAEAVADERTHSFYPSLYLNLGFCYEMLGNRTEASKYYERAAEKMVHLPPGPYSEVVRYGVAEGLKRLRAVDA